MARSRNQGGILQPDIVKDLQFLAEIITLVCRGVAGEELKFPQFAYLMITLNPVSYPPD